MIFTREILRCSYLACPETDDEWGSPRQLEAEARFADSAYLLLSEADGERLSTYWLKATTEEAVTYGLKLIAATDAQKSLTEELNAWCAENGVEPASADEIQADLDLMYGDVFSMKEWIDDFISRWEESN